jgi:hypothetical protein
MEMMCQCKRKQPLVCMHMLVEEKTSTEQLHQRNSKRKQQQQQQHRQQHNVDTHASEIFSYVAKIHEIQPTLDARSAEFEQFEPEAEFHRLDPRDPNANYAHVRQM